MVWVGQNIKETRNWVVSELEKKSKEQDGGTFARNSTDYICESYIYTILSLLSSKLYHLILYRPLLLYFGYATSQSSQAKFIFSRPKIHVKPDIICCWYGIVTWCPESKRILLNTLSTQHIWCQQFFIAILK